MAVVFLSGSISIKELPVEVKERLGRVVNNGHEVIVGDASGADWVLQAELARLGAKAVQVFYAGLNLDTCRHNHGAWQSVACPSPASGASFYRAKDRVMQQRAEFGFCVWDGKSPGTLDNIKMLLSQGKRCLVWHDPQGRFLTQQEVALLYT